MYILSIIILYKYKDLLIYLIIRPNIIVTEEGTLYYIYTNLTETLTIYLDIIIIITNVMATIFFMFQIFLFLAPSLYYFEYKRTLSFILKTVALFFLITVFFYKIILPKSLKFFIFFNYPTNVNSNSGIPLHFEPKITEYVNFFFDVYFITIVSIFLFYYLLNFILFNTSDSLIEVKKRRRVLFFSSVLLSTILTPPDIASQIILSSFLMILIELALLFKLSFLS